MENFITKDQNYSPGEHQIKCSSGAVFDASEEPLLSEILTDYYAQRKDAQKVAKKAEMEANELEHILDTRLKSTSEAFR